MIGEESLLVTLVRLLDRLPVPPVPAKRPRGRPKTYPDRLFLKALVIMIVRYLITVHELLSVVAQPTPEMRTLRPLLTLNGQFPTRRTWERRLQAIPTTLPAQIGCLGRALVALLQPFATCGRAAAIDSTVLRARGGVWHEKDREAGVSRTRRSIPRRTGPNPAGTAGFMAGSCIWSPVLPQSGSRWPPS